MTRRIGGMTHQEILTKHNKDTLPQDDWGYETLRRWEDAPQGDGGDAIPKCIFCTQVLKESPTLIHIHY